MKTLSFSILFLVLLSTSILAQTPVRNSAAEEAVLTPVKRFYQGFNEGTFLRAEEYTTADWNHINPMGGRTIGRDATLKDVRAVHQTFLKGVTDTPEGYDVKFSSPDVAIVVVPSKLSTLTLPDGIKRENARNVRTFVVVKRNSRWLIQHDHNTFISP
jgi:uncharacterized protein (TIGR02246 family)